MNTLHAKKQILFFLLLSIIFSSHIKPAGPAKHLIAAGILATALGGMYLNEEATRSKKSDLERERHLLQRTTKLLRQPLNDDLPWPSSPILYPIMDSMDKDFYKSPLYRGHGEARPNDFYHCKEIFKREAINSGITFLSTIGLLCLYAATHKMGPLVGYSALATALTTGVKIPFMHPHELDTLRGDIAFHRALQLQLQAKIDYIYPDGPPPYQEEASELCSERVEMAQLEQPLQQELEKAEEEAPPTSSCQTSECCDHPN